MALSHELLVLLIWNEKGSKLIGYGTVYVTFLFDHSHDLDLEFSRSKFETALCWELEGRLTWNKRDLSWSFMAMTVTFVWPWSWVGPVGECTW